MTERADKPDYGRASRRKMRQASLERAVESGLDRERAESLFGGATAHHTYTYRDVVNAYLEAQRFADKHEDLAGFYHDRLLALTTAFGLPGDWTVENIRREDRAQMRLFHHSCRIYNQWYSPFHYFLEAPDAIREFYHRFGRDLGDSAERHQQLLFDLMCDIFAHTFGRTDQVATSDDLRALGFDDTDPPQEEDYQ